jgi:hypothetical protein
LYAKGRKPEAEELDAAAREEAQRLLWREHCSRAFGAGPPGSCAFPS